MSKKIMIGAKPTGRQLSAEEWVANRAAEPEATIEPIKMKRLTIDVSDELHRRIKAACALRGSKMADEVRELLEKHFS